MFELFIEVRPRRVDLPGRLGDVPGVGLELGQKEIALGEVAELAQGLDPGGVREDRFGLLPERLRQVLSLDRVAVGHDQQTLDDVLELADVAFPGEGGHGLQGVRGELPRPEIVLLGEGPRKIVDEKRDVLLPLAQGRRIERDDVQAEEEVLPEPPLLDLLPQVLVGRGDDPDVDLGDLARADLLDFTLLEDAQDLGLGPEAHVADLVEKDRAAVGLLELTRLLLRGPGEGPLLVAEELRFDELLRDGGAVDLDEGLAGPQAVGVDRPGDELLAGAALAVDEHGGVGRGDLEDLLPQVLDEGMVADDLVVLLGLLLEVLALAAEARLLEGVADADKDALAMERLLQKIEGSELGRLDGRLDGPLPRDHDDLRHERPGPELGQNLETALPRHLDVQEDEVDADRLPEHLQAVLAGRGLEELVAFVLEDHLQRLADVLFVIDDQDPGFPLGSHRRCNLFKDSSTL
ncbi:MAG: hypothetical protein WCC00_05705 [Candidatus Aminicenantales bacterium]